MCINVSRIQQSLCLICQSFKIKNHTPIKIQSQLSQISHKTKWSRQLQSKINPTENDDKWPLIRPVNKTKYVKPHRYRKNPNSMDSNISKVRWTWVIFDPYEDDDIYVDQPTTQSCNIKNHLFPNFQKIQIYTKSPDKWKSNSHIKTHKIKSKSHEK